MQYKLLLTCEHACLFIPDEWVELFKDHNERLISSEGWDIGAYQAFDSIRKAFESDAFYGKWSRLLVDLNRSVTHRDLFSSITKNLTNEQKEDILRKYYYPYRERIIKQIEVNKKGKFCTLHLSIHSFPSNVRKNARTTDIGLLYDPKRPKEKYLANQLKESILTLTDEFQIRMNYPFLGTSDGLTSYLRKQLPQKYYLGLEIELNQKHLKRKRHRNGIIESLTQALLDMISQ